MCYRCLLYLGHGEPSVVATSDTRRHSVRTQGSSERTFHKLPCDVVRRLSAEEAGASGGSGGCGEEAGTSGGSGGCGEVRVEVPVRRCSLTTDKRDFEQQVRGAVIVGVWSVV